MTEQLYDECVRRVKTLLVKNKSNESPENYVNEAWLLLSESNKSITEITIYNKARVLIIDQKNRSSCFISKQTTKICSRCKNDLPIVLFNLRYFKNLGRYYPESRCTPCKIEANKYYNSWERCREKLTDGYMRRCLKSRGYKMKDITTDLILTARVEIGNERIRRSQKKNFQNCNTL